MTIVFVLFHGYGCSKLWWDYKPSDSSSKLIKLSF